MGSRPLPWTRRMRLRPYGELRALSRLLAAKTSEPIFNAMERNWTMDTAQTEIIEATIRVENTAMPINLDEDITRVIYDHAWNRFEQALVNANALYNEEPAAGLEHNRMKRLLWEVDDLKRYIDVLYTLTALPEDDDES